jgi:hypothetical protein
MTNPSKTRRHFTVRQKPEAVELCLQLCARIPTRAAHRMHAPETEPMHVLTWHDFDRAVASIAERLHGRRFRGVHGLPRGGLVLAVSLSHRLELPLLPDPPPVTP